MWIGVAVVLAFVVFVGWAVCRVASDADDEAAEREWERLSDLLP